MRERQCWLNFAHTNRNQHYAIRKMATNEQVKSKRELMSERLKTKYPDREYADDEALFSQINDDYDAYDGELNGFREREKSLVDVFNRDPRSAQFLTDMAKGQDPWSNLIRRVGVEGMTDILNDPDKQEAFEAANKEYLERVAKSKELDEQYDRNLAESQTTVAQMQAERGIDDDTMDKALDWLGQVANEVLLGKFTKESIEMALKAINHDVDVEAASQDGEVRGRNSRVEAKLRKPSRGDGMPTLGGSNNSPRGGDQNKSIFDLAAEAK